MKPLGLASIYWHHLVFGLQKKLGEEGLGPMITKLSHGRIYLHDPQRKSHTQKIACLNWIIGNQSIPIPSYSIKKKTCLDNFDHPS